MSVDIPFEIIVDTREQKPFAFGSIYPQARTVVRTLQSGDYSIVGHERDFAVERKSIQDLYGSIGSGRDRFKAEILRLKKYRFAAVVVEGDLAEIAAGTTHSKLSPVTVIRTMLSWSVKHGIQWWPCPDRDFAIRVTYNLMRFYLQSLTEIESD